jgi:hypothetical protein
MNADELVQALESGVQPVVYVNAFNSLGKVTASEQLDPEGGITFTVEVENHGVYSGIDALEFFDDRQPEYAEDPPPPATEWAWTQNAAVTSIAEQVAEARGGGSE